MGVIKAHLWGKCNNITYSHVFFSKLDKKISRMGMNGIIQFTFKFYAQYYVPRALPHQAQVQRRQEFEEGARKEQTKSPPKNFLIFVSESQIYKQTFLDSLTFFFCRSPKYEYISVPDASVNQSVIQSPAETYLLTLQNWINSFIPSWQETCLLLSHIREVQEYSRPEQEACATVVAHTFPHYAILTLPSPQWRWCPQGTFLPNCARMGKWSVLTYDNIQVKYTYTKKNSV